MGLPLTSIRPTSFHTNFLTYDAESLRKENCFRSPLGNQAKVNWVHCRDIGEVAAALLLKKETPGTTTSSEDDRNLVYFKVVYIVLSYLFSQQKYETSGAHRAALNDRLRPPTTHRFDQTVK